MLILRFTGQRVRGGTVKGKYLLAAKLSILILKLIDSFCLVEAVFADIYLNKLFNSQTVMRVLDYILTTNLNADRCAVEFFL